VAERRSRYRARCLPALVFAIVVLIAAVAVAGAQAAAGKAPGTTAKASRLVRTPLGGWLGDGTSFPNRALVLTPPAGTKLSAASVSVTENGAAAGPLTVTPTTQAQAGDFGVVILIDQSSSMAGAPLAAAIAATRTLAGQRAAGQQLGLITFDGTPSLFLHLSSDSKAIDLGLSRATWTGTGANVPAAVSLGLRQLAQARLALGAVVVVSDGVGRLTAPGGPTPASVQASAAAAHAPVITVGLQDAAATAASLHALSQAAPGQFVQTPPAKLASVFKEIYSAVTRGYVVRWRSRQRPGKTISVAARAAGVPGSVNVDYRTPAAPAAAKAPVARGSSSGSRHGRTVTPAAFSKLSRQPGIVLGNPASASRSKPNQSFWGSPRAVPIVAGIFGLLVAMTVLLALYRPSKRAVRLRVGSFIPAPVESENEAPLAAPRKGLGLLRALERGNWWLPFVEDVEIARSPRTPGYLVKRAAIIAVVLAVLVTLVSGSLLLAMVPILAWPWALRKLMGRAAEKQREKFRDVLPGYLQDLASAMRVGRSFVGGISVVAESADEPVHGELDRAVTDEALGRPLEESLEAVAKRMQAPDMDQVALIAGLNRRSGSNVAEALDRVAEGARERADLRREVKALTAQAKMSSLVLTALPGVLLVGINLVSPLYAYPLFHTTIGIVLMGVGTGMVFAGWKVMKKITTVHA
jgi:Flp pilus assembly protein TadB